MILRTINAYTVISNVDEKSNSKKGIYKDYNSALAASIGSGWWNSNGEVKLMDNIWIDENDILYRVQTIGTFDEITTEKKEQLLNSIKSKLSKSELELLNIKL